VTPRKSTASRFVLAILILGLSTSAWAADPPRIVTTIPPIHSLVAAVTKGVVDPVLLVRGNTSPHEYAMAPSDARALQNAQLLVWVGPALETFVVRALRDPRESRRVITLMDQDGIALLETRAGGAFDDHDHDHDHDHDDDAHDDDAGGHIDAHLWLDPSNAARTIQVVADALIALDPSRADTYRANAARALANIARLDETLMATLAPVRHRPFIVFHDAYQYLERRYDLAVAGSVTVAPDRKPGARRLRDIQHHIAEAGVVCVFAEPQFQPAVLDTVIEGTAARAGVADPLGAALEPGPDLYPALMRDLARSLADCLSPHS